MSKLLNIPVDEEISLRILTLKDAPAIFELVDRNRSFLRKFLPWVDYNTTVEDSKQFIRERLRLFKKDLGFSLCIMYQGKIVGTIGLHYIDKGDSKTEIGYWLVKNQQGKGIMHRSCWALINYCFTHLKLHRIEIRSAADNIASQRVIKRLGFKKEGVLRDSTLQNKTFQDTIVYSMLSYEFKPNKKRTKRT